MSMIVEAPFTLDFLTPFYDGEPTDPRITRGYHVSIGDHGYMIDVAKLQFATVPSQREATDDSDEPGETTLNPAGAWPRGASRFDKGAGQEFFDLKMEDLESSRRRWFESKGVDGMTDPNGLQLLGEVERSFSSTETNLYVVSAAGWNYFANGDVLFGNEVGTTNTATDTSAGDITSLSTDGKWIYITNGTTLERAEIGDTSSPIATFGALTPDRTFFANGRLLGVEDHALYEISNAGAKVGSADIYSYPFGTGGGWSACTGSPIGIFVAFTLGGKSSIFHMTTDDTGADLTSPRFAGEIPGETVESLTSFARFIIIGTSLGVRVASYSENGDLDIGPLIETGSAVRAVHPAKDFVYFAWSNYDSTSTGIGRLDLTRNTEDEAFKPAYQSDLMATAQGEVQGIAESTNGLTGEQSIAFTVAGQGAYSLNGDLVESGTYDSGRVRWGTLIPKIVSGVEVGHDPLDGEVHVSIQTMDSVREIGSSSVVGSLTSGLLNASVYARSARVLLTLNRDGSDATRGPVVRFWRASALPAPSQSEEWGLPLVWKRSIVNLSGDKKTQDLVSEYEYLQGLQDSGEMVPVRVGDLTFDAQVRRLVGEAGEWERFSEGKEFGGGAERRMPEGTLTVVLMSRERQG